MFQLSPEELKIHRVALVSMPSMTVRVVVIVVVMVMEAVVVFTTIVVVSVTVTLLAMVNPPSLRV